MHIDMNGLIEDWELSWTLKDMRQVIDALDIYASLSIFRWKKATVLKNG